ncbi:MULTISPECIES: acyl-CoA dehydrogenase family protein [unclassified Pseudomonas]|uniref:acyl-CoA dehydrogenase family protein n=1 Tax=unclassified Pseudomonas TaxID=196821 RepID=UPI0025D299C4|nr:MULTISPECIES: acyl-CoA dehydrogenase [unclassified Pseudomonas]
MTDEQRMLVDGAQRYVRERYDFETRRGIIKREKGFSTQHWHDYANLGWLALAIAEEDGGLNGSDVDVALLMEILGEGLLLEPVAECAVLCASLIGAGAKGPLRESLLMRIASGEMLIALAHQEQTTRHEYDRQIHTTARRVADGWELSGVKQRVFFGVNADAWLVSATLEGKPGLAIFLVEAGSPGATLDSYELISGSHGADLHLDRVIVRECSMLIAPDKGADALEYALDRALVANGAMCLGSMEGVMAMTADYLKTRVQYGKPLAQFQALQHRMAEMFVETDLARSILFGALAALESGDVERRRFSVSGMKVVLAKAYLFVTAQGIQLHGGIGTTEEYAVGHHYKAAVVFDQRWGDSDFHLQRSSTDQNQVEQPMGGALHA